MDKNANISNQQTGSQGPLSSYLERNRDRALVMTLKNWAVNQSLFNRIMQKREGSTKQNTKVNVAILTNSSYVLFQLSTASHRVFLRLFKLFAMTYSKANLSSGARFSQVLTSSVASGLSSS